MKTIKISKLFYTASIIIVTFFTLQSCSSDDCEYDTQTKLIEPYTLNISTGIDNLNNSLPMGTLDPLWSIALPNPSPSQPKISDIFTGFWEVTPILTTNAKWINPDGNSFGFLNTPGFYTFERSFTVINGTALLTYNFNATIDNELTTVELINPSTVSSSLLSSPIIPSTFLFNVTNKFNGSVASPQIGVWKIRITGKFYDTTAIFLVSGYINLT